MDSGRSHTSAPTISAERRGSPEQRLLSALNEYAAARGYLLDERPGAQVSIPVVSRETTALLVEVILLEELM